jgi:hypothetical protein
MIWIAGRSPTLVSHSLRGVATNLKATTLTYLAITVQFIVIVDILMPGHLYSFIAIENDPCVIDNCQRENEASQPAV